MYYIWIYIGKCGPLSRTLFCSKHECTSRCKIQNKRYTFYVNIFQPIGQIKNQYSIYICINYISFNTWWVSFSSNVFGDHSFKLFGIFWFIDMLTFFLINILETLFCAKHWNRYISFSKRSLYFFLPRLQIRLLKYKHYFAYLGNVFLHLVFDLCY